MNEQEQRRDRAPAKRIFFEHVCNEGKWPVYRCDNDGQFYFLVNYRSPYEFTSVLGQDLWDKYEGIWNSRIRRANDEE